MSTNHIPDRIRLTGVSARGYHGALPFERSEGQLFSVDITADLGERGTAVAAVTDSLTDAVDYGVVARAVVSVIEGEPVNLIETLAERIADAVLVIPRVSGVEVTVHKPQAPLDVAFDDVMVTISRFVDTPASEAGRPVRHSEAPMASASSSAFTERSPRSADASAWAGAGSPAAPVSASPAYSAPATPSPAAPVSASPSYSAPVTPSPAAPVSASSAASGAPAYGDPVRDGAARDWTPEASPAAASPDFGAAAPSYTDPAAPLQPQSVPSGDPMASAPDFGRSATGTPVFGQPVTQAQPQAGSPATPVAAASPAFAAPAAGTPGMAAPALGAAGWGGPGAGGHPVAAPVDPLSERPAKPAAVVIALGGNVGGVVAALRLAVGALYETEGLKITAVAPLARTAAFLPEGSPEQPDYLNTVVLAETTLSPRDVLAVCNALEADAGRVRTEPHGPRTLDADLVSYEGVTAATPELTLPHPRAAQRAFVLVPWAQADPFAEIDSQSVSSLAEAAPDRDGVRWLALDWLDSDHLPALPTGQYVEPPVAGDPSPMESVPTAMSSGSSADGPLVQPQAGSPVGGGPEPYEPQPAAPQESPSGGQAPSGLGGAPSGFGQPYDAPVGASAPEPSGYAVPAPSSTDDDASWNPDMNWNHVIGRNDDNRGF